MLTDLRFALRQIRRSPGFTAAAVITLALGIGACTAAYSLSRGLLWKPLPFPDPDRIVVLHAANTSRGISGGEISEPDLRDLQRRVHGVTGLMALAQRQAALGTPEGADRITGWIAEPALFDVVGVQASLGRVFRADEATPDAARVMVLSYGFWTRRFGADSTIIGRILSLNGMPTTVVGVMPASFQFVRGDVWMPLVPEPANPRDERDYTIVGRLTRGTRIEAARAEIQAVAATLAAEHPETNRGWSIEVTRYRDELVDAGAQRSVFLMLASVGVVLLIACANVAGLLMARGAARSRELAVRSAIGASRVRLIRQALIESGVLALLGAGLGIVLAAWSNDLLLASLPLEDTPVWLDQSLDANSLAVTVAIALASVFLFGLWPALRASRPSVVDTLKGGARSAAGTRARSALVVTQVGLAVALLAAAMLFSESFLARQRSTFGFDDRPVLTARVFFGAVLFRGDRIGWMRDALAQVRAMPGVRAAALTGAIPGDDGGDHRALGIEGAAIAPGDEPIGTMVPASDGFLDAIGIAPISGRWFTSAEAGDRNARVAVIGETLAKRFWPRGDAVGHRIRVVPDTAWLSIVGVVPNLQWEELSEDRAPDRLQLHVPYGYASWRSAALLVRSAGGPAALGEPLRRTTRAVSADVPIFDVRTMSEVRQETSAGDRVWVLVFGALGLQALLMTAVGLYGLLAFSVAERQREIGVRVALGARPAAVVRLVVGRALRLTGIGLGVGLAGAFLTARALAAGLYGVTGTLTPLLGVFVTLLLTALLAAFLPARSAARVDPMVALRAE